MMTGDEKCIKDQKEIPEEQECKKATEKAMRLLLQQDRTYKELKDRLYRAGYSEQAANYAMNYVMGFGYIDDRRYAGNYISYHKKTKSKKEIRYKLLNKGIEPDVLASAFEEYDTEDEYEAIRQLILKRLKGQKLSELEFEQKNKIIAYLARKGYALPAIKHIVREQIASESDKNL